MLVVFCICVVFIVASVLLLYYLIVRKQKETPITNYQQPTVYSNPLKPLFTKDSLIVNGQGNVIKLYGASWVSHLETMLPEGLADGSVESIAKVLSSMGINCIRFTFSTDFATQYHNSTGRQTALPYLGASSLISEIDTKNPGLLDKSLEDIYKIVIGALGKENIMVIMDNHVSKAGWCCDQNDQNAWWGRFDVNEWLNGLRYVTHTFGPLPNVVGISLRNEPRGKNDGRELVEFMNKGAQVVNSINKDLLIFVSGMDFASDVRPFRDFEQEFWDNLPTDKIVFEVHHYPWFSNDFNNIQAKWVFLQDRKHPLFVSEWGFDVNTFNEGDSWFSFMYNMLQQYNLSHTFWQALPRYYIRSGVISSRESYSLLNDNLDGPRSNRLIELLKRLIN